MPAVNESTQLRVAKLIMVTAGNNDKYYDMQENLYGTIAVKCKHLGGADLINNEYIVYNSAQCTIRYLVEVR